MTAALAGLRVVDFTTTIAGPHCTRLLADLGATVIKIEAPDGDMMRTRPPLRDGASAMFGQLNVNKQSVVLDLKNPQGVAAARKLIAGADVLVENYRPGVMKRLGLDYPSVSAANPRLVYCAISGYGQTGPSANLAAYAPVVQAASGYELTHIFYQDGRTKPDNMGIWVADVISGTYAFGAVSAALHQRNATGRGQFIDVSMLECMLTLPLLELQSSQFPFTMASRRFAEPLKTADGYIIVAIASELTFQGAAAATGNPGWVSDSRFAKYADRRLNWGEFIGELEAWMAERTTADCVAALSEHGVPCSAYRTVAEALKDPQLKHRQALVEVMDEAGPYVALNQPFHMSELPPRLTATSPSLGEHTEAVLGALGYSEAEIAALSGRGTAAKAAAE
jgi:crotonobetainyl-CoA:carnitine CoA-transferase CaiB-like acyl-CoA transferase